MIDVHAMRVFNAVAENLSFTRAAERLLLTQSAVSHQIAKLERDLGVKLIQREGRTISLTPAGRTMQAEARKVFAAIEDASNAIRSTATPGRQRLRIGASATACQFILPEALREFRECFPTCVLAVEVGDGPHLVQRLLAGAVDLGIIIRPEGKVPLKYHALMEDELSIVVGSPHPWAAVGEKKGIKPAMLAEEKLIHYSKQSATFRLIERHYARLRVPLTNTMELGEIAAIKELLKLGLGFSMLAGWVCRPELESGALAKIRLPGPSLRREWTIATPKDHDLTLVEETFIGLCQAVAGSMNTL